MIALLILKKLIEDGLINDDVDGTLSSDVKYRCRFCHLKGFGSKAVKTKEEVYYSRFYNCYLCKDHSQDELSDEFINLIGNKLSPLNSTASSIKDAKNSITNKT